MNCNLTTVERGALEDINNGDCPGGIVKLADLKTRELLAGGHNTGGVVAHSDVIWPLDLDGASWWDGVVRGEHYGVGSLLIWLEVVLGQTDPCDNTWFVVNNVIRNSVEFSHSKVVLISEFDVGERIRRCHGDWVHDAIDGPGEDTGRLSWLDEN